jgi:hypothetical protein
LVFDTYTKWIADNIQRQRIVFVSHVGDIVDKNVPEQWEVARRCMDRLHGRVPYGISVGNHDMESNGDSSLFQRYFPESRFKGFSWYGGCFNTEADDQSVSGNNANGFQLFSAEGLDFIFLHLECNAPDNVLIWANGVLGRYADRRALVTTHMGLGPRDTPRTSQDFFDAPKGRMRWKKRHGERGNTPEQMWQKCFSKHGNLFIIFYGDQSRTQAMRQTTRGEHGNPIHEVLSDYGAAGLRVYRFVPKENLIRVYTVSPIDGTLCIGTRIVPDPTQHQFTLEYDMSEKTTPVGEKAAILLRPPLPMNARRPTGAGPTGFNRPVATHELRRNQLLVRGRQRHRGDHRPSRLFASWGEQKTPVRIPHGSHAVYLPLPSGPSQNYQRSAAEPPLLGRWRHWGAGVDVGV